MHGFDFIKDLTGVMLVADLVGLAATVAGTTPEDPLGDRRIRRWPACGSP